MSRGRISKKLPREAIRRLKEFRDAKRYSYPQLKLAMAAPFKWSTLKRAMEGDPIWEHNHAFILDWLERVIPSQPVAPVRDRKSVAAGEDPQFEATAAEPAEDEAQFAHSRLRSE